MALLVAAVELDCVILDIQWRRSMCVCGDMIDIYGRERERERERARGEGKKKL